MTALVRSGRKGCSAKFKKTTRLVGFRGAAAPPPVWQLVAAEFAVRLHVGPGGNARRISHLKKRWSTKRSRTWRAVYKASLTTPEIYKNAPHTVKSFRGCCLTCVGPTSSLLPLHCSCHRAMHRACTHRGHAQGRSSCRRRDKRGISVVVVLYALPNVGRREKRV